jgi:hypothetical protein
LPYGGRDDANTTKFKDDTEEYLYLGELLDHPNREVIAKALDAFGCEIRPAPELAHLGRWRMSKPCDDCPSWADNGAPKPPRPPLKMIDGDKKGPRRTPPRRTASDTA